MMKADGIKRNFIFQISYQTLILVIPLIISPYLTRVLGSNNLGIYTYVNSIAYYFLIFANLGISKHAQRVIANSRDNNEELRKNFWGLYSLHSIFSILSLFIYAFLSLFVVEENQTVFLLHIFYVVSALFDITWLFQGLENFKSVVIRNAFVKVLECVLIFVFVKTINDLWIYTIIMSASILLGHLIMLPSALKIVPPIRIQIKNMTMHLKPMLVLFVAVVASTLYTVLDKTLLGLMATKSEVAYYEYANKIITIPKQLIIVIGVVMFPRACRVYNERKFDQLEEYIDLSMLATCFLSFAFTFGIMAIGRKFAVLYYGEEFEKTGEVLFWMAPLIFVVMIGDIIRSEYLIPAKKDFLYTLCMVISAVLNILLSIVFIPIMGIYGAIIGTTIAEVFGLVFQIISCRGIYPPKRLLFKAIPFMFAGVIMFMILCFIDTSTPTSFPYLLMEIGIGVIIYIVLSLLVFLTFFDKQRRSIIRIFHKK